MRKKIDYESGEAVDQTAEVPQDKKPATEPWSAEAAPESPRKRGLLGLPHGKPGFELRWVRHDSVDRRKNQGYVLAKPEDFDATPDENGMIRRNELVLMMVPKEVYDGRRAEIARITTEQSKAGRREYLREREAASRQSGQNLSDESRDEE